MTEEIPNQYDFFIDVILPIAINQSYTYRVSKDFQSQVKTGSRVIVPFNRGRLLTGIVEKIHNAPPKLYEAKYIINVFDEMPVVNSLHLEFWKWISGYYLCTLGEVMNAALPAALKLTSETRIILNKNESLEIDHLNDKEYLIVEALQMHDSISISDIQKILDQKTVMPLIKSMIQKQIIILFEELEEKYKPKRVKTISLNDSFAEAGMLKALFEQLEKRPKQVDLLQTYLRLSKQSKEIEQRLLLEESGISVAVLNTMIKNEIFLITNKVISRLDDPEIEEISDLILNDSQAKGLVEIENAFSEKLPVLLHGVTSSGKTMVYIKAINKTIEEGKSVLILVPEIGLTTQLIDRYRQYFNNQIGVYHSKYNESERVEIWNKVNNNQYKIILGTRSSLFLPFHDLGLIIVDEEHDPSYKQNEPSPKYHARDAAIYLAKKHQINIILGSATPSSESYFNSLQDKYRIVKMNERHGGVSLPDIEIVALQKDFVSGKGSKLFGRTLLDEIGICLNKKQQVILFQNRRGYAPFLQCHTCGLVPQCVQCDVSLTYHKWKNELKCHYCGYKTPTVNTCPACGSGHMEMKGHGTEKIEDELKEIFPEARIARMDLDTTRKKNSLQELINEFQSGNIDILVGTQMVTKGLDFDNVTLVGIIQADALINHPDFRSHERAFQLIEQVSGRAGRRNIKGKVIIQSFKPEHPILQLASRHDYQTYVHQQLNERKQFSYPPYVRMIELTVKHKEMNKVQLAANKLAAELKKDFGKNVLGPEFPAISKIRNQYINKIVVKIEKKFNLEKAKFLLKESVFKIKSDKNLQQCTILIDVDPY